MREVKLQYFEYLKGAMEIGGKTNPFTGSVAFKDNSRITDEEFLYIVFVSKTEKEENEIKAQYYVGINAICETDKSLLTEKVFEFSQSGVDEAKKWLQSEYERIFNERNE